MLQRDSSRKHTKRPDRNQPVVTKKSQPPSEKVAAPDAASPMIDETPFNAPMPKHISALAEASAEQRVTVARELQQA